jgi:hypothetical protein
LRLGIDQPLIEQAEVAVQARHAVRINAAKISRGEDIGSLDGIRFGNSKMKKNASTEFPENIDGKYPGLDGGHVRPFLAQQALCNDARLLNLQMQF